MATGLSEREVRPLTCPQHPGAPRATSSGRPAPVASEEVRLRGGRRWGQWTVPASAPPGEKPPGSKRALPRR